MSSRAAPSTPPPSLLAPTSLPPSLVCCAWHAPQPRQCSGSSARASRRHRSPPIAARLQVCATCPHHTGPPLPRLWLLHRRQGEAPPRILSGQAVAALQPFSCLLNSTRTYGAPRRPDRLEQRQGSLPAQQEQRLPIEIRSTVLRFATIPDRASSMVGLRCDEGRFADLTGCRTVRKPAGDRHPGTTTSTPSPEDMGRGRCPFIQKGRRAVLDSNGMGHRVTYTYDREVS